MIIERQAALRSSTLPTKLISPAEVNLPTEAIAFIGCDFMTALSIANLSVMGTCPGHVKARVEDDRPSNPQNHAPLTRQNRPAIKPAGSESYTERRSFKPVLEAPGVSVRQHPAVHGPSCAWCRGQSSWRDRCAAEHSSVRPLDNRRAVPNASDILQGSCRSVS